MIIFVGDEPSKKNLDPEVAFVGTKSYKTLLEWIYKMNISVTDVVICNKKDVKKYNNSGAINVDANGFCLDLTYDDKVIALGENASKYLHDLNVGFFKLPHPSGLNRKLNDKKWLKQQLNACGKWIANK